MAPLAEHLAAALALVGLASLTGYATCRLLLPAALRPWAWLAAPVLGLMTMVVALGWLNLVLPLRLGTWLFLITVLVSDGVLWLRSHLSPRNQALSSLGPAWVEQGVVGGLMGMALFLGLLPLWDRPDLLAIGPNWDIEIYLPLAEYLKDFPNGFSFTQPAGVPFPGEPNPLLWRLNFFDPRAGGLAFSQVHAAVGVLLQQGAHQALVGLLAALYALALAAVFLLLRAGFTLGSLPSLLAVGLLSINPAGLYIVYWSFGQQTISFVLLPLALLALFMALRDPSVRSVALAGLSLAALLVAYPPALPLYLFPFVALVAHSFVGLASRRAVILVVVGALGGSLLFAPWAYLSVLYRIYYFWQEGGTSGLTLGPNVTQFPPVSWALGLFSTPESGLAGLLEPHSWSATVASGAAGFLFLGFAFAGLVWALRRGNYPLVFCGLTPVALLLTLRYVAPYPYGYLKLLPSSAFLLSSLCIVGGWALWQAAPTFGGRLLRPCLTVGMLSLVATSLISLAGLISAIKPGSTAEYRDLEALERTIPPGASVYLAGSREYRGPKAGALAYFLRRAALYGYLETGFSTFYRQEANGVYDFAVLHEKDTPLPELGAVGQLVWQGLGIRVYRLPEDLRYFQDLGLAATPPVIQRTAGQGSAGGQRITQWDADGYPDFTGWSPPLLGVLAETIPPRVRYPELTHREGLEISLPEVPQGPDAGSTATASVTPDRGEELVVTLASFRTLPATLYVNGEPRPITVSPGLASYHVGAITPPARLTISNESNFSLYVKSVMVKRPSPTIGDYTPFPDALLVRWSSSPMEDGVRLTVNYLGPPYQPVVDMYSLDGANHYGWWGLPTDLGGTPGQINQPGRAAPEGNQESGSGQAPEGSRGYFLRLDLPAQELYLSQRRGETKLSGWQGARKDGDYRAYLVFWQGDQAIQSIPLFEFTLQGESVTRVAEDPEQLVIK